MEELVVTTVVYADQEEVYDFLRDFPGYASYSEHLRRVRQAGDGGEGTRYALEFAWWKLTYTAESKVTALEPPGRIDWQLVGDFEARGSWSVESMAEIPSDAPDDADSASEVTFEVRYEPSSVHGGMVDLPRLVSLDWVIEKARPLVEREAERVVERAVADLEGRERAVQLTVTTGSD